MPEPLPPIDYSSRDWVSLRTDLIAAKKQRMPEWKSESPNDFGIVLIELFAYVGDMLSFYADRIANEAYLDTAVLRSSVYALARMLDYRPTGQVAAATTLTFTTPASAGSVTIPAGTRVQTVPTAGEQPIVFETTADLVIVGGGGTHVGTVAATQGVTITNEAVGFSDGTQYQRFALFQSPVIDGSQIVSVAGYQWTFYDHLLDAGPNDTAYTIITDEGGITWIEFGDDVNGRTPTPGAAITVTYRTGAGRAGNVAAGTLKQLTSAVVVLGVTQPVQDVTNSTAAVGGADPETLDSIRINAPRSLAAINRAVTTDDYAALARRMGGVGKARATGTAGAVTVYVAPTNSPGGTASGNNEVQTITITGTPTGGTFTLTYAGQTTGAIAYNAAAAAIQTALQALTTIGTGNAVVTGGPGPGTPYVVTFTQALGLQDLALMTATSSLTGGTAPAVAVTETTKGVPGVKGNVQAYLEPRKMIGTVVTIADPTYLNVDVTVDINVLPTYRRTVVINEVTKSITALFNYDRMDFGSRITLSAVYKAMNQTEGVDYGFVYTLGAAPSTPGTAADVVATNAQIPQAGTITVRNATGGIV